MKNRKIYIVLGLLGLIPISMFVISMLFVVTSDAQGWVYESYCNNSEHEKAHKKFYGKEVGSKECFDYANKHFDEINSDNNKKGHSSGCRAIEAPFPWSLVVK